MMKKALTLAAATVLAWALGLALILSRIPDLHH
jgi:hypothetical protein